MEEVDTSHHRDQKAALKHSLFSILLKKNTFLILNILEILNVSIFYFIIVVIS